MADDSTITSLSLGRGREPAVTAVRRQLVVLTNADAPLEPSSRHVLDGIDEVRFGRGPRRAHRDLTGRTRVLELSLPDKRMSTEHGRLVWNGKAWVLDDPASKNGAVVDGVLTRRTAVQDGALIELGHTFLLLHTTRADDAAPDVRDDELPVEHPAFRTFDGELARQFQALARIATTEVSVVLLGETGTGKEVIARAVHELSGRKGAFVAVNCGALPTTLIESELFGHRRGAFSGAIADRAGLVRRADAGTLLLDEVGELPAPSQVAFLRVLQEREVVPVGDERAVKVDIRLCAATLRDLDGLVATGGFRADLFARLAGVTIELPPLRRRRADLGILIRALLARLPGADRLRFDAGAVRVLLAHDWPHNIRELDKVLGAAAALSPDAVITADHLPSIAPDDAPEAVATPANDDPPVDDDKLRSELIALLTVHHGNVRAVANALGRQRTQVYRWLERYALRVDDYRR